MSKFIFKIIMNLFYIKSDAAKVLLFSIILLFITVNLGGGDIRKFDFYSRSVNASITYAEADGWKEPLADYIEKYDHKWMKEVGLFLYINSKKHYDGRIAKSLDEICYFVSRGLGEDLQDRCSTESYARVRYAINKNMDYGVLQNVKYVSSDVMHYKLNELGLKAYQGIYERWISKGGEKYRFLALIDLGYPGSEEKLKWLKREGEY